MTELWKLSAVEAVEKLKAKEVTPLQLVEAAYERYKEVNPIINAVVVDMWDYAKEYAAQLEANPPPNYGKPGYLYGLPVVIKENTAIKGHGWTMGSLAYKGQVADRNDPLTDNLLDNGAVIIGKGNVPEFLAGVDSVNDVYGKTRNPWDTTRSAGGSSGGSGAAVAAGIAWAGTGTDLGGSIRVPAAVNGLVGFRPGTGVVPAELWCSPEDAHKLNIESINSPIARTVADCALILDAMTGAHPKDPRVTEPEMPFIEAIAPGKFPPPKRVAWSPGFGITAPENMDEEVIGICEKAANWFATLGAEVVPDCPDYSDAGTVFTTPQRARYASPVNPWELPKLIREGKESLMAPGIVTNVKAGMALTPEEIEAGYQAHLAFQEKVHKFFESYDLLISPLFTAPTFPVGETKPGTWLTTPTSLVHLPCISVPCGFTSQGWPLGLQITGRPGQDAFIMNVAAQFEAAHDFCRTPIDPNVQHMEE